MSAAAWLVVVAVAAAVLAWPSRSGSMGAGSMGARSMGAGSLRPGPRRRPQANPDLAGPFAACGPGPLSWAQIRDWIRDWLRVRARARPADLDRSVLALLEAVAAPLRAGLTTGQAFGYAARTADGETPDGAAARLDPLAGLAQRLARHAATGARLEPVLRGAAAELDSPALTATAAAWAMSERYGAPVVDVIDGLVAALRDSARTAAAVETALAAPRATATLLAVLPLGGLALGELVGVHPVAVLVGTSFGRAALALGLTATWLGRVWMHRLVRRVERLALS